MKLLHIFESNQVSIKGWQIWITEGEAGPSLYSEHSIPSSIHDTCSAIASARSAILQRHSEWAARLDATESTLLFCIIQTEADSI